ncbi:MAG: segregation/condensation protein A [Acidimicrobiia bacterium]|nr:segregation/condensation protein A [Acidimicrobiia bacterium]MDH4309796.1 segregation/condensation protein A [Acidimicrobiia bacterium]
MTYHVKTAVFEGPLDLLLQLITRHQVDVTAVSLTDLVSEYLTYLEDMRSLDLDVTSEFLLIAATLIQLKVRHLLPDDAEVDLDEELALMEERDRLLSRLLMCVTFKDVAAVLSARLQVANRFVPRNAGLDQKIAPRPVEISIPVDAPGLHRIAEKVFTERPSEPDLDHLDLDLPSVQSAIEELRVRVSEAVDTTFESLVEHCTRKVEVAAYFLALLELARWGLVELAQNDWLAQIEVRHRPDSDNGPIQSEWAT